jgi:enoyl-CoA hydratase/carnithine racemase
MSYQTLIVTRDEGIAVIQLNRPDKRNSITFQMMDELEAALDDLSEGNDTRVVIITGDERAFSSGMDLNGMENIGSPREFTAYMTRWRVLNKAIEMCTLPVIAAIEGYCYTGGFELALACDVRVGAEGSSYAITSSKIGTVPGAGGTQRLPRIVGIPNALDILFSADPIDAQRAYQLGVLQRLTSKGGALAGAKELARSYATRAPLSLQFNKRAVYAGMQMPLSEAIEFEGFMVNTIYNSSDKREGILAFLEKRPARFTGT